ncbi:hypothetical protein CBR_g22042 [Chara braunii]|uniref:DUF4360 domain-containing protein n=1 Tax=Chara braunii TaxID=69332 RepID=A0A388L1U6_CHABU|nr:hypothetical protein CBR_g22042 [Chara braunii]|eukprot:GBG76294.1 hypothetical protein CBR_g22042 [Chara braunii]
MVILLLLGLLQLAVPGLAQSPPAGAVKITAFKYSGTGCPPGSAEGVISFDGQTLTIIFSKYTVFTPGSPADRRKNCQVTVALEYPSGFTFTLATVTYGGLYAQLEPGVTGTLAAAYYFSGIPETARSKRELLPPLEGNFEFTDKFATVVYQACGVQPAIINLFFEASVKPPPGSKAVGLITVGSQDLRLKQIYRFIWKKC